MSLPVRMNKQKDEVLVKVDGVWNVTKDFTYVVATPENDPAPTVDLKQQELQTRVVVLKQQVADAIIDMKQKKEILDLNACDQGEYDKKVEHYKMVKAAYEEAKLLAE